MGVYCIQLARPWKLIFNTPYFSDLCGQLSPFSCWSKTLQQYFTYQSQLFVTLFPYSSFSQLLDEELPSTWHLSLFLHQVPPALVSLRGNAARVFWSLALLYGQRFFWINIAFIGQVNVCSLLLFSCFVFHLTDVYEAITTAQSLIVPEIKQEMYVYLALKNTRCQPPFSVKSLLS